MPTKGVRLRDKLSVSASALIWFGAAVSLAEILTGTFFAPLGLTHGLAAILLGHAIGAVLFWLVAYISAMTGKSAMEAARLSFGRHGSLLFSLSNVAQLIGWTAIMVFSGSVAAQCLAPALGQALWCVLIGALIIVWIAIGMRMMARLQAVASALLLIMTLLMSLAVFGVAEPAPPLPANAGQAPDAPSFGAAVELAVAMPLSWLPVVGDYTRQSAKPGRAVTAATLAYFLGSSWMYVVGLGAGLFAGSSDIVAILAASGLGGAVILIVVLSTVTTTFLDAKSAGISAASALPHDGAIGRHLPKLLGILAAAIGTALAAFAPVARFEDFLYLIGSVFAPMAAILVVDFFVFKNDFSAKAAGWANLALWAFGFALYRLSFSWDTPLGNTLPVLLVIGALSCAVKLCMRLSQRRH
jgi:putative hydroxymethylpyrimidine transporter CytX